MRAGGPTFAEVLARAAARSEACLKARLPLVSDGRIAEAMRYAALAKGKRLRGFLAIEGAELHGLGAQLGDGLAAAVECLHAYSLVHDDLPAMDDDDLRRGVPTLHIKWDEATAVLAGDALQAEAFDILANLDAPDPAGLLVAIKGLARAAGGRGMVQGQALDIAAETAPVPLGLDEITHLQSLKTGALISWAATAGAVVAGDDPSALADYAAAIGLAFQIHDDVLDVTGDATLAGKRLGKDEAAGKATFVSLLGLEAARRRAQDLSTRACDALAPYGPRGDNLRAAAQYIVTRRA
ncbi:MAG: polyprenyl synthetase family protein [Paracoccaceae bacterium]